MKNTSHKGPPNVYRLQEKAQNCQISTSTPRGLLIKQASSVYRLQEKATKGDTPTLAAFTSRYNVEN
jgi:hypothetical protein